MNTSDILNKIKNFTSAEKVPAKSSAVIIPLVELAGELHILFEQRSLQISFQPGDVCFPGGRIENGESPLEAALREIGEELLIDKDSLCSQIEILTELAPIAGPTGALVYPFVALLRDYNMTFSKDEVEKVFTYPISFFNENPPIKYEMQREATPPMDFPYKKVTGGNDTYKWHSQKYDMWIYEDTDPVIWGFTGRLLHSFLNLI